LNRRLAVNAKELEAKVKALENQVRTLTDIEEIKTLQKTYGYYLEHWMSQEIIDLFSDDPDVSLTLAPGTYLGKERIAEYFNRHKDPDPEFLHQVMQLSGVVNVDPEGKTAEGRWYGFGAVALPSDRGVRQFFMGGIYGGEYVKENGVWKIKRLRFDASYTAAPATGWVAPERLAPAETRPAITGPQADVPRTFSPRYPSGYIFPFHYKHPVTGKKTSEEERNASIEGVRDWKYS
jgi:hypothetical protein